MMVMLDYGATPASTDDRSRALGAVLEGRGFSASEQAVAFMLMAHGADIDAATDNGVIFRYKDLRSAASMYANINLFIERWHVIAVAALSRMVEVDRRVGLGLNGLYPCSCLIYRAAPYISPWES
jgi:hypothetical protein